jgi:hypothetical protein
VARYDEVDLDDAKNPSVTKSFYTRIFPWKQLFGWLNQEHGASPIYFTCMNTI